MNIELQINRISAHSLSFNDPLTELWIRYQFKDIRTVNPPRTDVIG